MSDRSTWDLRYDRHELIHGAEPSEYLLKNQGLLPKAGLALDIAAGEGRNALFLSALGLETVAIDISLPALKKCLLSAGGRGLRVGAAAVDLTCYPIPADTFDVMVNFNYLQRDLVPQMIGGLRPGGVLFFETMTVDHLRYKPGFNPEFLLGPGELLNLFQGLHIIKYREATLEAERGPRAVASLIARRSH